MTNLTNLVSVIAFSVNCTACAELEGIAEQIKTELLKSASKIAAEVGAHFGYQLTVGDGVTEYETP